MSIGARRKPALTMTRRRRPLSAQSLHMMLMSGVVRRADLNPPAAPHRHPSSDDPHGAFPQESASEQGWLSRMFLGRKTQASAANRS